MISLLFDGYAGGHLSKTPGVSVVQWRGRAADPTVERGHTMSLTCPLSDPPHGKQVHHRQPPTTVALRRGKCPDPVREGYQTSACPLQTLEWSIAIQNTPGERGPSFSIFQGHLVVNLHLSGIQVPWKRADKPKHSLSWGSEYLHMWNPGFAWASLHHGEMPALYLLWGRNVSSQIQFPWQSWDQGQDHNSHPPKKIAVPASLQETLIQAKNRWSLAGPWTHTGMVFSF